MDVWTSSVKKSSVGLCPDLAMSGCRRSQQAGLSTWDFIKRAEVHVEALNLALRDISPDRMQLQRAWRPRNFGERLPVVRMRWDDEITKASARYPAWSLG